MQNSLALRGRPGLTVSLLLGVLAAAGAVAGTFVPEPYAVAAVGGAVFVTVMSLGPWMIHHRTRCAYAPVIAEYEARVSHAEREREHERGARTLLRELGHGLDQAETEPAAIATLIEILGRQLPTRSTELHLVDSVDPVLALAAVSGPRVGAPGGRTSPWDSLAARDNAVQVCATSSGDDVCPHLRSRCPEPSAAIAVPVTVTGRLLGLLYVFAEEGTVFGPGEVALAQDLALTIAARFAVLRSDARPEPSEAVDRLTGLPDRDAMQSRIIQLLEERQPFTVAVADIDDFGTLNAQHGRAAGDRALQTAALVSRRTIRPEDVVGRIGGDELLLLLPRTSAADAGRALERLREELVLELSNAACPAFTLSMGVIASDAAAAIEDVLHKAAAALAHARADGGNRVVVADSATSPPEPATR